MRDDIIKRLEKLDYYSHVDIIHLLRKEIGDFLYYDDSVGLVLRHPVGTVFAVPFSCDFQPLYDAIGEEELISVHSERMYEHYLSIGYSSNGPCYTYSYHGGMLDEGPYEYRIMRFNDLDILKEHYNASEESLIYDLEHENVFSIEKDGTVMGFCGFHCEDSMGLLVIFPEYRRKGLGTYMESHVINEALRRRQVPFCNVYLTNEASIGLQEKLGLIKGDVLSCWVWKERS